MLAAQPEVLFTYPSQAGDYDKIGQPSLQDGVRRLTRCSPRDNHGKVKEDVDWPTTAAYRLKVAVGDSSSY